ncbi:MAG: HAD-IA family hydrolase [Verrucomicrobia bacterium]|nr:HAD-IA family hydrolase [Verrucomicrobiota bacterium]
MTFLFDIGKVLLNFDFLPSLAKLLPPGLIPRFDRIATLLDRRIEFETGALDPDEFVTWALGVLQSPATPDEFRSAWRHVFFPVDAMWPAVNRLAAGGHRLILFSNTNALHCPWVFEEFPEFGVFKEAVLSFEVGAMKPDPRIYQHAIDAYQLDPARTRYIDDLPENIARGREFGFRCFQYDLTDHAAFERWLAAELAEG